MRFLGVDQAYRNTGLVILDEAGRLLWREHLRNPAATEPEGFFWWGAKAHFNLQPGDVVVMEGLSFGSRGRLVSPAGTFAMWQAAAYERCVDTLIIVPPIRAKCWAVNDAKATKSQMIAWARPIFAALGSAGKVSEHEADALALALLAKATRQLPGLLPDYRARILENPKGTGVLQGENIYRFGTTTGASHG